MKFKFTLLSILSLFSVTFTSCDSREQSIEPTDRAESLTEHAIDDTLHFRATNGTTALTQLVFQEPLIAANDFDLRFEYIKTANFTFRLEVQENVTNEERFAQIVANLLGGESALATEFREIIAFKDSPSFTDEEIERLIAILNIAGASITGETVEDLRTNTPLSYNLVVESSALDLVRGTMGGRYNAAFNHAAVSFRLPTREELEEYRLLPETSQIPIVDETIFTVEDSEVGTWSMELSNN